MNTGKRIQTMKQARQIITEMYLDKQLNKKLKDKYVNRAIVGTIVLGLIGMYFALAAEDYKTLTMVIAPILLWDFACFQELRTYNKRRKQVEDGSYFTMHDKDFYLAVANQLYERNPDFKFK